MASPPLTESALRTMHAVADAGTLTGAARVLGHSQPAVSQQIRRLERRLGTALLERTGRSVRLTEAGQVLARHGATVVAALDAASEEVAAISGLRAGRVRLAAFPSSSATLVPAALALLRERHPGVVVTFNEAEPPESLAQLRAGECDLAVAFAYPGTDVGRGEDDLAGLAITHLLDDPLYVALPSRHPLARGPQTRAVDLAALSAETWIAGCPRCRGNLLQACQAAGYAPSIAYATDDYVAVLGLVAASLGIALIPGLVLRTAHHHDVTIRPVRPASVRDVHVVTTPDLARVPAVAAMLGVLAETADVS